jgi:hypothetical protein
MCELSCLIFLIKHKFSSAASTKQATRCWLYIFVVARHKNLIEFSLNEITFNLKFGYIFFCLLSSLYLFHFALFREKWRFLYFSLVNNNKGKERILKRNSFSLLHFFISIMIVTLTCSFLVILWTNNDLIFTLTLHKMLCCYVARENLINKYLLRVLRAFLNSN